MRTLATCAIIAGMAMLAYMGLIITDNPCVTDAGRRPSIIECIP